MPAACGHVAWAAAPVCGMGCSGGHSAQPRSMVQGVAMVWGAPTGCACMAQEASPGCGVWCMGGMVCRGVVWCRARCATWVYGGVVRGHRAWCGEQPWCGEHLPAVVMWHGEWTWGVSQGAWGGMVHGWGGGTWSRGMPWGVAMAGEEPSGCVAWGMALGSGTG